MTSDEQKWAYEPPTRWIHRRASPHRPDPAVMGDSGPWIKHITTMWQALADPTGGHSFPPAPKQEDVGWPPYAPTAYWAPLPHLLRHSFGWRSLSGPRGWSPEEGQHMALGLQRLLDQDHLSPARDDVRVRFLFEAWGQEHLDAFAAWASGQLSSGSNDAARLAPAVRALVEGGDDPLHLSAHWDSPLEPVQAGDLTSRPAEPRYLEAHDGPSRGGVLLLNSYAGWSARLHELGNWLGAAVPSHVDVVAQPVGWLGTFRRSADTGVWFAGDERLHLLGH